MIDNIEEQPLSSEDLRRMIGPGPKILPYSALRKYSSIEDLLGADGAIVLYRDKPQYGHWVAIIPGPSEGVISYFDSYGSNVDEHLLSLTDEQKIDLGQEGPWLSILLQKAFDDGTLKKLEVNRKQLQSNKESVADCGRYAALRIIFSGMSNEEFVKQITDKSGKGTVADRNVSLLTAML